MDRETKKRERERARKKESTKKHNPCKHTLKKNRKIKQDRLLRKYSKDRSTKLGYSSISMQLTKR